MHIHRQSIRNAIMAAIAAAQSMPALATGYSPYVESWRDRAVQGAFTSAKPAQSLQRCLASGLKPLATSGTIHSEALTARITEMDASALQFGVRIVDQGSQRVLLFISEPELNDRAAAAIRNCA